MDSLTQLTPRQRDRVARLITALTLPVTTYACPDSDIATPEFIAEMSDVLRGHHAVSSKSLGKEFFEYALADVLADLGHQTQLSPSSFPGADLLVDHSRWSLKTEASKTIRGDLIHISKMMELGKGAWKTASDLESLRDSMLTHLTRYDRIFSMRYLAGAKNRAGSAEHEYELVEIPKAVLERSANFSCSMHEASTQNPKPGECKVIDAAGLLEFELYFDGGTERKLQVRKLRLDLCVVHARWSFPVTK